MERVRVNSSNIKSVGYDPFRAFLEIEFHNSGVYLYSGVPERVYERLMAASSKGTYFNDHIKGVYSYRKVR